MGDLQALVNTQPLSGDLQALVNIQPLGITLAQSRATKAGARSAFLSLVSPWLCSSCWSLCAASLFLQRPLPSQVYLYTRSPFVASV